MRILFISVIILIFGLLDVLNPVRDVFQSAMSPIQFGLRKTAVSMKDSLVLFQNVNKIRQENLKLIEENRSLREIVVDLKQAEEENTLLRAQLDLKNQGIIEKDLLLADVMGNSGDLTGTSLMLDKGTRHGIKIGDNVISGNSVVGIITETTGERSVVSLVVSPEVSMTVNSAELDSGAEGLAKGNLGTTIKVSRLLPSEVVEKGDIFITDGRDGRMVPGLSVGSVESITSASADPIKTAVLEPLVDFSRLHKVFVILSE